MPTLTVSGNEITDARRQAALGWGTSQQGGSTDGFPVPDSSFGIWEAAINLFRRGQCDATTDWNATSAGGLHDPTRSIDPTVPAPFGPQSMKYVCDGSGASQGVIADSAAGQAAAAGTLGVGSISFKGVAGQPYLVSLIWVNADASSTAGTTLAFNGSGAYVTVAAPALAVAAGKTGDKLRISVAINGTRAETIWAAHAMLQKGVGVVSPYVATSGGATAARNAARIQASASLVTPTRGWVAARPRVGWSDAQSAGFTFNPRVFTWDNDASNRLLLLYNRGGLSFGFSQILAGVTTGVGASLPSLNAGDIPTVIGFWDGTTLGISVNGGAFATVNVGTLVALTALTFDIGQEGGANLLDGDMLWLACGVGTLTDHDAATIHALAQLGDPHIDVLPGNPTMAWSADTVDYRTPTGLTASIGDGALYGATVSDATLYGSDITDGALYACAISDTLRP